MSSRNPGLKNSSDLNDLNLPNPFTENSSERMAFQAAQADGPDGGESEVTESVSCLVQSHCFYEILE